MNKRRNTIYGTLLLACCFAAQSAWGQKVFRDITVSADKPHADHINLDRHATDKDIMVKFSFDEAANQLTVSMISNRMLFVFWDDVRYKPMTKGRTIRPELLPYFVTYDKKDKFRFSKLFKSSLPQPRKKYVFYRWLEYDKIQPVPQDYAMVNDYITQTFEIPKKGTEAVIQLRDVMLMDDVSKHPNKRKYEISFGVDLDIFYRVKIQRNPCFGLDEDMQSAQAALDGIRKSYSNLKKKFGRNANVSEDGKAMFEELKETLLKQFPRRESKTECPELQAILDDYNTYTDSIARMDVKVTFDANAAKGMLGQGINERQLLSRARQIDTAVSRWLISNDQIERRDIILNIEDIIKSVNAAVTQQGVYTAEQRQALSVFREAERYFRNNCSR